ncbi:hypothetical protein HK100_005550, partial [Physocladia obscura]
MKKNLYTVRIEVVATKESAKQQQEQEQEQKNAEQKQHEQLLFPTDGIFSTNLQPTYRRGPCASLKKLKKFFGEESQALQHTIGDARLGRLAIDWINFDATPPNTMQISTMTTSTTSTTTANAHPAPVNTAHANEANEVAGLFVPYQSGQTLLNA